MYFDNRQKLNRIIVISVIASASLFLAWGGQLDAASIEYLNESISGASIIFATARGLNALISVLQGTEIEVLFINVALGEWLDPLNDLIERFSAVIMAAIGTLVVAKLMVELFGHEAFNILVSVSAVLAIAAAFFERERIFNICAKLFFITLAIRLGLSLIFLAVSFVDTAFLEEQEQNQHETMTEFKERLGDVASLIDANPDSPREIERLSNQVLILKKEKMDIQTRLEQTEKEQKAIEGELKLLCHPRPRTGCSLTLPKSKRPRLATLASQFDQKEESIQSIKNNLEIVQERLEYLTEKRDCAQRKADGDSCSILTKLKNTFQIDIQEGLKGISTSTRAFVDDTVKLLSSLVLKSIVLPLGILLFFYLLFRTLMRRAGRVGQIKSNEMHN